MKEDTKYLTSIRGLACLMVVIAHILANIEGVGYNVSGCGKIGVWLFFILSALLLTYQWIGKEKINGKEIVKFYIKRVFRIFPCYIVILISAFLIGYISDGATVIKHIFLVEGIGHFWTIPVEFIFYIFVPLIMFILFRFKNNLKSIGFLLILLIISEIMSPYWNCPENSINLRWYFPVFIMGMIVAYIYEYFKNKNVKSIRNDILICVVMFFMICSIPYIRNVFFGIAPDSYLQNKFLYFGLAWSIVIISIQNSKYIINILNNSKILLWLGNISFPLYLIHYIVISKIKIENVFINAMVIFVVSILLSIIVNKLIEVPAIKLGKKICNLI